MQKSAERETSSKVANQLPRKETTRPFSRESSDREPKWTYGAGTPFPQIPLSEFCYDGEKLFDDCEPWIL